MQGAASARARLRVPVAVKFSIALGVAILWTMFSIWVSSRWKDDLGALTHPLAALVAITFIAYVPGFMNAFLVATLLLDRRPPRVRQESYPGITILIAAFQEEAAIADTLKSIAREDYPGAIEVIVLSDGSTDRTVAEAEAAARAHDFSANSVVRIIDYAANRGKAAVLNSGLAEASHDLIVTIDGDSRLEGGALTHIVERLLSDPPETVVVAGAVLVRNAHESLMVAAQEWDYFHGIAAVKRMQSMYHGTLVAQGAFSIYRREALIEVGGWPECVGEDIVLTWAMLRKGHRVGYAEDAIVFTNAPTTYRQFALQRKRWSRGLIEALDHHERLLFQPRLAVLFIWWNLLFLPLDLIYTFVFIPGLIAAFFGIFWIAGPMTLAVLPLAGLWNILIYRKQKRMVRRQKVEMRHHMGGLLYYLFVYTLVMQPVCVWGYASEIMGRTKKWGTK
ncbi:glycosyltransferase [Allosphingosinicella vermicomposti]|uniref:glycosyltransferase n=1 Tax=Allosphingosinicella vermicomposti TaxID=614671 RepID=UPI000D0FB084|nr:glycosyltransferase [Allosphingosinicella vermicomposti]